jgi:hypothetical protein
MTKNKQELKYWDVWHPPQVDIFKHIKLLNLMYNLIHKACGCIPRTIHPQDLFVRKEVDTVYIRMVIKIMALRFLHSFVYSKSNVYIHSLLPLNSSAGYPLSGKSVNAKKSTCSLQRFLTEVSSHRWAVVAHKMKFYDLNIFSFQNFNFMLTFICLL